jgi:hypothetical protein
VDAVARVAAEIVDHDDAAQLSAGNKYHSLVSLKGLSAPPSIVDWIMGRQMPRPNIS